MNHHSEETNELFNLMARQIKRRCEERINLYTVESDRNNSVDKKPQILMNEDELDEFIMTD